MTKNALRIMRCRELADAGKTIVSIAIDPEAVQRLLRAEGLLTEVVDWDLATTAERKAARVAMGNALARLIDLIVEAEMHFADQVEP